LKKILIVDDELLVRVGFRSILEWEKYGFTVVGDACNGEEALEKIRLLQPDLVFTDLKMEHMDGLELMKTCMREYPSIKFIVLSSYNDFENVRQAMRCGALDYVFKLDVKSDQLKKILSQIKWEPTELEDEGQSGQRAIHSSVIREIITGETSPGESKKRFLQIYPTLEWEKKFRLITVAIDDYELRKSQQRLSQRAILAIENILEDVFAKQAVVCPLQADRTFLIWQKDDLEALGRLQMAYGRAEEYIKRYLNESMTAVISEPQNSLAHLQQAHKQNEETLAYRYLLDPGRIHSYHHIVKDECLEPPFDINKLDVALAVKDGQQVADVCAAAFSQMSRRRGYPLQKLRVNLLDMFFAIKRVYPDIATWTDDEGHTLAGLIQCSDRLSTVRSGFEQALAICMVSDRTNKQTQRPEIQKILRYVKEHPTEDIKVSRAAEITRLSESYFAHIFKREMGISFVEWLNRDRIERARKMLYQSDKRVNEIAASVGIDNANYFSILFKKITGRTPMQERRMKKQNYEETIEK
jgi:two-component system response regulator YesN